MRYLQLAMSQSWISGILGLRQVHEPWYEGEAPRHLCYHIHQCCVSGVVIGPGTPTMKYQVQWLWQNNVEYQVHCTWSTTVYDGLWRQQKQHVHSASVKIMLNIIYNVEHGLCTWSDTLNLIRYTEPDQVHEPCTWLWRQQQRQHVRTASVANLRKSTSDPWEAPLSFYCTSGTPSIEQCIHPHIIYFRPMGRNTKCIDQAHLPQWTIAYVQHTFFQHIGE